MKGAHGGHFIGCNVPAAVDARHDLIVAEEVVQAANDRGQLSALALAAKEELQVETLQAVADKGYHEADPLEACEQAGVETCVPDQGKNSGRGPDGQEISPKAQFRYDAAADAYHCPAGQTLARGHESPSRGKDWIAYYHRATIGPPSGRLPDPVRSKASAPPAPIGRWGGGPTKRGGGAGGRASGGAARDRGRAQNDRRTRLGDAESLSENCVGSCGEGFWRWPGRRGPSRTGQRSIPAAGCDGPSQRGPRPKFLENRTPTEFSNRL